MRVVYDRLGKRIGAPPFLRLPELWKERVERMENAKKKSGKKKVLIWVLIVQLALAGGAALAAAFVDGQRGHPVGFAARWRRELLALTGDEGARAVIGGNRGLLRRIYTADPGVLQDVDRPGDIPP